MRGAESRAAGARRTGAVDLCPGHLRTLQRSRRVRRQRERARGPDTAELLRRDKQTAGVLPRAHQLDRS